MRKLLRFVKCERYNLVFYLKESNVSRIKVILEQKTCLYLFLIVHLHFFHPLRGLFFHLTNQKILNGFWLVKICIRIDSSRKLLKILNPLVGRKDMLCITNRYKSIEYRVNVYIVNISLWPIECLAVTLI